MATQYFSHVHYLTEMSGRDCEYESNESCPCYSGRCDMNDRRSTRYDDYIAPPVQHMSDYIEPHNQPNYRTRYVQNVSDIKPAKSNDVERPVRHTADQTPQHSSRSTHKQKNTSKLNRRVSFTNDIDNDTIYPQRYRERHRSYREEWPGSSSSDKNEVVHTARIIRNDESQDEDEGMARNVQEPSAQRQRQRSASSISSSSVESGYAFKDYRQMHKSYLSSSPMREGSHSPPSVLVSRSPPASFVATRYSTSPPSVASCRRSTRYVRRSRESEDDSVSVVSEDGSDFASFDGGDRGSDVEVGRVGMSSDEEEEGDEIRGDGYIGFGYESEA